MLLYLFDKNDSGPTLNFEMSTEVQMVQLIIGWVC